MTHHLFTENSNTTRTYALALKRTEMLPEGTRFVIATTPEGRFFPVVIGGDVQLAIELAHAGFAVAN